MLRELKNIKDPGSRFYIALIATILLTLVLTGVQHTLV